MIELREFTFTYAGETVPALHAMNFEIPSGQLCAVLGANGSGKSSLCYALTGFIPHFYRGTSTGQVSVDGRIVSDTPLAELASGIGLVFQNPFNQITGARFTVLEEVAFGLENLGVPREEILTRSMEALRVTGLADLGDRSPFGLSGGQQQRLAVASILAMNPSVLVLDEPTSQLDPAATEAIFARLAELSSSTDRTIVLTEHKLEWVAAFADRVLVLVDGRIAADGPPREVLGSMPLESFGVRPTGYTLAARRLGKSGHAAGAVPLPVTLSQAVEYLR